MRVTVVVLQVCDASLADALFHILLRQCQRIRLVVERLGLSDKADVFPKQLSAGEQKRVVIARSLINEPSLILADEPTSDLDAKTETEVMSILRGINADGVTFLIVTHSLDLVEFATRAFEMEHGILNQVYSDR